MRYIILFILNLPVILLAFLNSITQYKMRRIGKQRFYEQLLVWFVILVLIASSFPLYNLSMHKPIFDSTDLSAFDIAEITAIVFLFYVANNQRRKLDQTERRLRDLHQQLSIVLSKQKD